MRGIIVSLAMLLCFACSEETKKEDRLKEAASTAEHSTERTDTIFLGYRLGMTESEFDQHTQHLQDIGKIKADRFKDLYYPWPLEIDSDARAKWSMGEYVQDRLYSLMVGVESDKISSPGLIQLLVMDAFDEKYGFNYHKTESLISESPTYTWFKNNLRIEIMAGIADARIIYTDMTALKVKDSLDQQQRDSSLQQLRQDL